MEYVGGYLTNNFVLRYRKPCKIMSIIFKDSEDEGISSQIAIGYNNNILICNKEDIGDNPIVECIIEFDIDTAIQFRKELQRQIMKAKALEKEGNNG